jgi:DNA invertase Pin-like site-specific DNA recombinase
VSTYSDNDISAYSPKRRPGYESLLEAIKNREVDAVVVWHQDRLLRRTIDLEHYIDVCQPLKIATHTVKAVHFDLTTPAGRATAETLAGWASYEVETSTDRVKAAKLQAAKSGKSSGGNRAYGWLHNGLEHHPVEAPVVREIVRPFISGASWNSIAVDLNAREIPTAKGKMWTAINVSNVAQLPRHYGIRSPNGQEYKAAWAGTSLSSAMTA